MNHDGQPELGDVRVETYDDQLARYGYRIEVRAPQQCDDRHSLVQRRRDLNDSLPDQGDVLPVVNGGLLVLGGVRAPQRDLPPPQSYMTDHIVASGGFPLKCTRRASPMELSATLPDFCMPSW